MQSAEISSNFGQNLPALVSVSASTFVWAPYLPHRLVVLFVSKQVHVDVGADGGWPLEVDVILPETLQGVERPRLANNRKEIRASHFCFLSLNQYQYQYQYPGLRCCRSRTRKICSRFFPSSACFFLGSSPAESLAALTPVPLFWIFCSVSYAANPCCQPRAKTRLRYIRQTPLCEKMLPLSTRGGQH